jgi:hypothetical protein
MFCIIKCGSASKSLNLGLTVDEILALDPAVREVHHPFFDLPENGIKIRCY